MTRFFVIILALLLSVTASAAGTPKARGKAAPGPTFSVIPFYAPEKIWSLYEPFIMYLRKTTGDPWQLRLYNSHREFIDGLCSGEITVGLAGPVPLYNIYAECGAKPFLVALGKEGTPFYHSVIVTNDSKVRKLSELKGKKFGFFNGSTAAHIVPLKMLRNAGLAVADIEPVFLGSQDQIIQKLLTGEIAAAGVKESLAQQFINKRLKVIAVSDPLPNFAFIAAPSAPASTIRRFTRTLSGLHPATDTEDARLMSGWDNEIRQGFVLPGNRYFPLLETFHRTVGEGK